MGRFLTSSGNFPNVPNIPTASLYEYLGQTAMAADLATSYQVVEVHMYFSNDGSWLYGGQRLQDRSGNLWYRLLTNLPWGQRQPDEHGVFQRVSAAQRLARAELLGHERPCVAVGVPPAHSPDA
jgi:hypothetical protein